VIKVTTDEGQTPGIGNSKTIGNNDYPFALLKKGNWKNYTSLDGLAHSDVHTMYIDPGDVMWFGTEGGVSRYDGKGFINFSIRDGLSGNPVDAICCDNDGAMWFATRGGGVSRCDARATGDSPHFVNFTEKDGLAHNDVRAICCAPNGDLWFGTFNGVSRYNSREHFVTFRTEDGLAHNRMHTNSIHCDPDGIVWLGTENGLSRYNGKEFMNLTFDEGTDSKNWNFIHAICRDREGFLWIGTRSGAIRYDGEDFVKFSRKDKLPDGYVISIYQDLDGSIWFGIAFSPSHISRYDARDTGDRPHFVNFTKEDGAPDSNVTAIHRGPDGAMWFATDGSGVFRYDHREFVNFTAKDGLPEDSVFGICCCPDSKLWIGSGHYLSLYDGEHFSSLTREDGSPCSGICTIYMDPDGVIWFGTFDGGVYQYDGEKVTDIGAEKYLNLHVNSIYQDVDGNMWFGVGTVGRGTLARYDGVDFATFTMEGGSTHSSILCVYGEPDGTLWIGTRSGLYRYDGKEFANLTRGNGPAFGRVNTVQRGPDGALWIGTSSGLFRYDGTEFVNITTKDGLPHDFVNVIQFDPKGMLWLGTDGGGVAMYDGNTWSSLDTRDGLAGNRIRAIERTPDGSMWFATDIGLTRYCPEPSKSEARIISVTTDQAYYELSELPVFWTGQRVTIEYDSLDFKTVPEKRKYRYRIREIDADWRKPTRATSYDHVFHKEGDYTFEVQAIDRDLNYSEPAVLVLTVKPDPRLVSLQREVNHLRQEVGQKYHFDNIIGRSAVIRQVRALMERAIDSGLTVLITGETGTGKELVAKAIHYHSPRKDHPLLDRNCGAIPRDLLASDLFGHRKGAFTGAAEDKAGLFEAASGGTVMLDEISEMPEDAQVHLLRVLQERKVQRLGEHISRDVDVRVIAMTNRNLVREVTDGRFREDLYYRLNEFPIHIPALRERAEDIPILAEHFLREIDKEVDGLAPDVFEMLQSYPWPGNVRELRNEVHRACALVEEGARIQSYHFSSQVTRGESLIQNIISEKLSYSDSLELFRRRLVENALKACNGNRHEAAKMLGMARPNLVALIKRLGIK
jgi:DNA-binding NtrC family response regulator/ligand-binding sensor domain-containing protein